MVVEWIFPSVGAFVAIMTILLTEIIVSRKYKKIDAVEADIEDNTNRIERVRLEKARSGLNFDHYEELMAIAQLQQPPRPDLLEAAGAAFRQGMHSSNSAAKPFLSLEDPEDQRSLDEWDTKLWELFQKSLEGEATEITEIRSKLTNDYVVSTNQLYKKTQELRAEKNKLKLSVDRYNRWNLVFVLLGIIIALGKDLIS